MIHKKNCQHDQLFYQRRILAKELGDFIHIYGKETQQLAQKARMRKLLLQSKDDADPGATALLFL